MNLSYNEATGMGCSSLEEDLALCEKYGFDYIEIRFDMLRKYLIKHSLTDLKHYFEDHHLKPHAFNAVYFFNSMFSDKNTDINRERAVMGDFMLACHAGQKIGSNYMIVVPDLYIEDEITRHYESSWGQSLSDNIRILKKLSGIAKDYNMNLCLEPVGSIGCSVRTLEQAREIVETVNEPNVGYALDSFNLFKYCKSDDYSYFSQIDANKIFAVHINNCDNLSLKVLNHEHRCFCSEGIINLENYLSNIRKTGYNGMISIETFRPEYWKESPEWIISRAYSTTSDIVNNF